VYQALRRSFRQKQRHSSCTSLSFSAQKQQHHEDRNPCRPYLVSTLEVLRVKVFDAVFLDRVVWGSGENDCKKANERREMERLECLGFVRRIRSPSVPSPIVIG
jgi:hypothetical protein